NDLTRGHWWPLFGLFLLNALLGIGVTVGAAYLYAAFDLPNPRTLVLDEGLPAYIVLACSALTRSLTTLFATVMTAVVCLELRRVNEGAGVEELAAVFR